MGSNVRLSGLIAPLVLGGVVSCSFILNTNNTQCESTADCGLLGPEFQNFTCTPEKVCAKATDYCDTNLECSAANQNKPFLCKAHKCVEGCVAPPDNSKTATQVCQDAFGPSHICKDEVCVVGCETDAQCVTAKGPLNVCKDGACVEGCRTNAECIDAKGDSWTCVKETNTCANLLLPDNCFQVLKDPLPDLRNDDTIFVGFYSTLSFSGAALPNYGFLEGAELARSEIMGKNGSGIPMGSKRRPVAMLVCDQDRDPGGTIDHLMRLGIKFVVGAGNEVALRRHASRLAANGIVVTIGGDDEFIKSQNGHIWRAGSNARIVVAPRFSAQYLEPQLRSKLGLAQNEPLKVAFVGQSDALGSQMAEVVTKIPFNGATLDDPSNAANYTPISVGDPLAGADFVAKQANAAAQLLALKPHIVFVGTLNITYPNVIGAVEKDWPADHPYRPIWFLHTIGALPFTVNFVNSVFPAGPQREDFRRRVIGATNVSANPQLVQGYRGRHTAVFDANFMWTALPPAPGSTTPPKAGGPNSNSPQFYDAMYILLSSMVATQKENPTVDEIIAARAKTQPGPDVPKVNIGPETLDTYMPALANGAQLDLNGIFSSLDFVNHQVDAPQAVFCIRSGAPVPVPTSLVFDRVTQTLSGTGPTNLVFPECP